MQRSAGNRLFHVVVETADVAQRCIELLLKNKSGRLTFLPLSELRAQTVDMHKVAAFHERKNLPTDRKSRVLVPITEFLNFDSTIQRAVDSVWGKVLVAKDLDIANEAAKFCDAECTTKDGVRVCTSATKDYHSMLQTGSYLLEIRTFRPWLSRLIHRRLSCTVSVPLPVRLSAMVHGDQGFRATFLECMGLPVSIIMSIIKATR